MKMKHIRPIITKLMIFHFIFSLTIFILATVGFSHRSKMVIDVLLLPLFIWPIWLFFVGKGWNRVLLLTMALVFSLVMAASFMLKDENRLGRRRFTTSLGQIYVEQSFDFDRSKELPDRVELEKPLSLGFVKTIKGYFPKNESIGKIYEVSVHGNILQLKGDFGSYKFIHDGSQLQLIN